MRSFEQVDIVGFGGTSADGWMAHALCGLAVLVVLGVSLVFAPSALAAEDGQIAGKVTDASTQAAISGIGVCAREEGHPESVVCGSVNDFGEYTLEGLSPASYRVEFYSDRASVNYVPQEVTGVVVAAGESREVNLAMQLGGWITGTVTDASTQAAIAGIMVCVGPGNAEYLLNRQCAETGSNGEYTLSRVPPGAYGLMFFAPDQIGGALDYALQFYGGGSRRSEGREVTVSRGETTSEVNAALRPGGKIAGVVTDASTQAPIGGIEVCAHGSGEVEEMAIMVRCDATNANGEYTVSPLVTGEYTVAFDAPYESPLDYASQFYDDEVFASLARKVPVTTGDTTPGIDAALQPGGNVTGRVTAAATGAAIKGIDVCVVSIGRGTKQRCENTNANGEYALPQLQAEEDAIEFGGPLGENHGYVREYYSGKASLSEANPISVTPGATISGVDASLHAIGEESIKPPPITETPLQAGPAFAMPLLTKTPVVTVMGSKLVVSRDSAPVRVTCSDATCQGSIELAVQVTAKPAQGKHAQGKSALARKETLVLAKGSFSLAAGKDGSVSLRLTAAGRRDLAHARSHPLAAKLILSVQGGGTVTKPVLAV